jgi:hypothetical protein
MAFGYPSAGLEEKLMWTAFWLLLVQQALRGPGRLRVSWRAATTPAGGLVR